MVGYRLGEPPTSGMANKAILIGSNGALGAYAGNWIAEQTERFLNRKRVVEEEQSDETVTMEDAQTMTLMAYEGLKEMREWVKDSAGPVEDWEGSPTFNLKVLQYIKDFFPDVFEAWRKRNYT